MSKSKNVISRTGDLVSAPMKGDVEIKRGHLLVADATGFAQEAHEAPGLKVLGMADDSVSNKDGVDGAKQATARRGKDWYRFDNDIADPVTRAHLQQDCYIVDSETVSSSHNTNARSVAGILRDVDANAAWVEFK